MTRPEHCTDTRKALVEPRVWAPPCGQPDNLIRSRDYTRAEQQEEVPARDRERWRRTELQARMYKKQRGMSFMLWGKSKWYTKLGWKLEER